MNSSRFIFRFITTTFQVFNELFSRLFIIVDPDESESRSIIEAVKTLLSFCCDSSRYASSAARYCSFVIEVGLNFVIFH